MVFVNIDQSHYHNRRPLQLVSTWSLKSNYEFNLTQPNENCHNKNESLSVILVLVLKTLWGTVFVSEADEREIIVISEVHHRINAASDPKTDNHFQGTNQTISWAREKEKRDKN
ncbi:hypothetical protein RF11_05257 [Thelohanellus kitauei]|uniref:Uncharacterized protein n=1 Tax=Thelohanellus kitauei TaxID=669202 RepID=A0A0C2NBK6_THEKT|nr:hypothetical protein RF11_05257 [Thelohanellus kitauei]